MCSIPNSACYLPNAHPWFFCSPTPPPPVSSMHPLGVWYCPLSRNHLKVHAELLLSRSSHQLGQRTNMQGKDKPYTHRREARTLENMNGVLRGSLSEGWMSEPGLDDELAIPGSSEGQGCRAIGRRGPGGRSRHTARTGICGQPHCRAGMGGADHSLCCCADRG